MSGLAPKFNKTMEKLVCWTVIIWTLVLVFKIQIALCAGLYPDLEVDDDEDGQLQVNYDINNDLFDWGTDGRGSSIGSWTLGAISPVGTVNANRFSNQGAFFKNKRSVLSILALATKRPHKTLAEINHPPGDGFMPTRGKRRSLNGAVLLPPSSYLFRATYPMMQGFPYGFRSRRSVARQMKK